jgi:chromosome segregation ATPase
MSDQFLDEFCAKLEAALTETETQTTAADQEIGSHLARLTRRMELLAETVKNREQKDKALRESIMGEIAVFRATFGDSLSNASGKQEKIDQLERDIAEHAEAIQAGRRRVDELLRHLEQRDAELGQAKEQLRETEANLTSLQSDYESIAQERHRVGDSDAALATARAELEQARDEIESLRASAERIGAVERLLEVERQRANDLEERLNAETASGTKSVIAQQLADALRDTDAARDEAATLRDELQNLRREADERAAELDRVTAAKRPKAGRDAHKRQLGDMLLEAGVISQDQFDLAVATQSDSPTRSLAEILVEQGAAEEEVVAQAAAAQNRVLYVHLNQDKLDPAAAALITPKLARRHQCIPVRATDDSLVLAMADPMNVIAIEDVERASSRSVRPVMATQSAIAAAIGRLYQAAEERIS